MADEHEARERAYAAMEAALRATGMERHMLIEEALALWRQARCADGEPSLSAPSPDDDKGGA